MADDPTLKVLPQQTIPQDGCQWLASRRPLRLACPGPLAAQKPWPFCDYHVRQVQLLQQAFPEMTVTKPTGADFVSLTSSKTDLYEAFQQRAKAQQIQEAFPQVQCKHEGSQVRLCVPVFPLSPCWTPSATLRSVPLSTTLSCQWYCMDRRICPTLLTPLERARLHSFQDFVRDRMPPRFQTCLQAPWVTRLCLYHKQRLMYVLALYEQGLSALLQELLHHHVQTRWQQDGHEITWSWQVAEERRAAWEPLWTSEMVPYLQRLLKQWFGCAPATPKLSSAAAPDTFSLTWSTIPVQKPKQSQQKKEQKQTQHTTQQITATIPSAQQFDKSLDALGYTAEAPVPQERLPEFYIPPVYLWWQEHSEASLEQRAESAWFHVGRKWWCSRFRHSGEPCATLSLYVLAPGSTVPELLEIRVPTEYQGFVMFVMLQPQSPLTRMLCCWRTGAGKTTAINTMLNYFEADPRPKVIVCAKIQEFQTTLTDLKKPQDPEIPDIPNRYQQLLLSVSQKKLEEQYTTLARQKNLHFVKYWTFGQSCQATTTWLKTKIGADLSSATIDHLNAQTNPFHDCIILLDECHRLFYPENQGEKTTTQKGTESHMHRKQKKLTQLYQQWIYGAQRSVVLFLSATPTLIPTQETKAEFVLQQTLQLKNEQDTWDRVVLPLVQGETSPNNTPATAVPRGPGSYVSIVKQAAGMPLYTCSPEDLFVPTLVPVYLETPEALEKFTRKQQMASNYNETFYYQNYNVLHDETLLSQDHPKMRKIVSLLVRRYENAKTEQRTLTIVLVLGETRTLKHLAQYLVTLYPELFVEEQDGAPQTQKAHLVKLLPNEDLSLDVIMKKTAAQRIHLLLADFDKYFTGANFSGVEHMYLFSVPPAFSRYQQTMGRLTRLCARQSQSKEALTRIRCTMLYTVTPPEYVSQKSLTTDEQHLLQLSAEARAYRKDNIWPALQEQALDAFLYRAEKERIASQSTGGTCTRWEDVPLVLEKQRSLLSRTPSDKLAFSLYHWYRIPQTGGDAFVEAFSTAGLYLCTLYTQPVTTFQDHEAFAVLRHTDMHQKETLPWVLASNIQWLYPATWPQQRTLYVTWWRLITTTTTTTDVLRTPPEQPLAKPAVPDPTWTHHTPPLLLWTGAYVKELLAQPETVQFHLSYQAPLSLLEF